jgi:hypothetical protein
LNVNLRVKNLYLTRNFLKEKGVTAKTISFKEMSERHGGGETLVSPPMENLPKRAYVKKFTIGERWCLSTREASSRGEGVERVRGVEPPFQPWQGCVITVILHPQFCAGVRNRTAS